MPNPSSPRCYEQGSHGSKIDDRIDRLLKQERSVVDPTEKKKLLAEAFRYSNEDRYEIRLYDELQAFEMRKAVDYESWPDGFVHRLRYPDHLVEGCDSDGGFALLAS